MTDYDAWLTGIIAKRTPDVLRAVMELVSVAQRKGCCTAHDIESRNFAEPNCIGAAFKILPQIGMGYDGAPGPGGRLHIACIKSERPAAHGRLLPVWVVKDGARLDTALRAFRRAVLFADAKEPAQGVLL